VATVKKKFQLKVVFRKELAFGLRKYQKKVTIKFAKAEKGATFAPAIKAKFIGKYWQEAGLKKG
jgi:hypothetical protein